MEFVVKQTSELTEAEQTGILVLFNTIFEKDRSLEQFKNQFLNNPLGYSYHSMMIDKGQIVGCDSHIPSYYLVNGQRFLFANSVDTMINKHYRDIGNFYDMITAVHAYMKKEGVVCAYGFPNDNAYPVYTKSRLMRDIGSLATYCLPYRIGGIKPALKIFNWLSIALVKIYIFFTSLFPSKTVHHFPIEKEAATYNATRYKRLDGNYYTASYKDSKFVYKLMNYEGVRSAFLIDVFEKSAANFNKALRYIIKNHHNEFDILLYVGRLPFRFHGLMAIPQKLAPKNFHFTGEILRKGEIDNSLVFDINNWDVNLSNYDLL
jgi:hypothetical protein